MAESTCTNVSAPAFSLILYENVRKDYCQEGFLFGDIVRREKRTITDNDQEVVNIEITVNVNSFIPCPQEGYFYHNSGAINEKKLESFLGDHKKQKLVGWYKYKQIPSFKLTLREKIVMKRLASYFQPETPEYFLLLLLTSQAGSESGATHLYSQTFLRYNKNFQTLPMHIVNLKDSHDIYKGPEICSDTFKQLIKSLNLDTNKMHGYEMTTIIETGLEKHINDIVPELAEVEKSMFTLEQEIAELREKFNVLDACDEEDDPLDLFENGLDDEPLKEFKEEKKINSGYATRSVSIKHDVVDDGDQKVTRSYAQAANKKC